MTRTLLAVLIGLALAGCQPARIVTDPPPPPQANCDAGCWQPCTVDGITYTGQPGEAGAWDRLVIDVVAPLRSRLDQCELSRLACQQCIDRLKSAGVVH